MPKSASSAPSGSQAGSTLHNARPETDRAQAGYARSAPTGSHPAAEQRTVTRHRPADEHASGAAPPEAAPSGAAPPAIAPSGTTPSGTAQSGTAPSDVAPSGTTPSGTTPSGTASRDAAPGAGPEPARPPGDDATGAVQAHDITPDDDVPVITSARVVPASAATASTPKPSTPKASTPKAPSDKQPSWPHVIATTLRLWLQRRVAGRPGARRRAAIFGAVIIVFAAGGLTFALAQGRPAAAPKPARSAAPRQLSPGAVAAAAANRQAAATWVAAQVSHSVVVACDPVMCAALQSDGFPAGDLLPVSASANDPLGSAVVVSTTALRNQFGHRLPDVYAPVVLATFGTGEARVDIRVEAPDGGQAYLVTQRADQLARQASGQQLLGNKDLHVSAAAGAEIAAGNVDARLLITLATLAAQVHRVNVIAVGDSGPGASAGVPLRMLQISTLVSPGHPAQNATYLKAVLAFLKAQRPPFLASVSVTQQGGDSIVQVEFAAPSPLGLLGTRTAP
jgi:hypothetical protein